MDLKLFSTVFLTVFLAELGDKTQIATLLFAARENASPTAVFLAASLALVLTTGLGVLAGGIISGFLNPRYLSWFAGVAFILVGVWTLWSA